MRISPKDYLNFVATASFSPYAWDSISGRTFGAYALNNDQGLGRFLNMNFSTTLLLAPKSLEKKLRKRIQKEMMYGMQISIILRFTLRRLYFLIFHGK